MLIPCNSFSLTLAAQRVEALFDEALAPLGLSTRQYSLLRIAWDIGPIDLVPFGRLTMMTRPALRAALRPLQTTQLIQFLDNGTGRATAVTATPAGRRLLKRADRAWESAHLAFERALGPQRAETLRDTLAFVRTADFERIRPR